MNIIIPYTNGNSSYLIEYNNKLKRELLIGMWINRVVKVNTYNYLFIYYSLYITTLYIYILITIINQKI